LTGIRPWEQDARVGSTIFEEEHVPVPAGVTTPAEAANWVWSRGSSLLAQNMAAASIQARHFKTRPISDVAPVACPNADALRAFRSEWEKLQKKHGVRVNVAAPAKAAAAPKTAAELIYADMTRQYTAWKKAGCKLATRGAWWGAPAPGKTTGAKAVPSAEIPKITRLATTGHWRFENSRSGELGWHKSGGTGKPDFIYHTKTP
jgi:hypothetical protein